MCGVSAKPWTDIDPDSMLSAIRNETDKQLSQRTLQLYLAMLQKWICMLYALLSPNHVIPIIDTFIF